HRLGIVFDEREALPIDLCPPALGQGALAVQIRAGDGELRARVAPLEDPATRIAVTAERELLRLMGASCEIPLGAIGRSHDGGVELAALREDDWLVVTSRHGAEAVAPWGQPRAAVAAIGAATAERLRAYGVRVAFQPSASSGAALARELPRTSGVVLLARSDRALS